MEQGQGGAQPAVSDRGRARAHQGAARAGARDQACDRVRSQGIRRRTGGGDALMAYFEPMDPARGGPMPYRRIKRRSHRSLAVALAIGVMAMSAGGLWVGYRFSAGRTPSGEIPLIHADADPIKIKPDDPGGMEIPNRDRFVFNPTGNMPVERLLPPPETPLPRPAPTNVAPPSIGPATVAVVPQVPLAAPAPNPAPAPAPSTVPTVSAPPPPQVAAVPTPAPGTEGKG